MGIGRKGMNGEDEIFVMLIMFLDRYPVSGEVKLVHVTNSCVLVSTQGKK